MQKMEEIRAFEVRRGPRDACRPACRPACPAGGAAVRSTVRYRGTADATFILMKVIKCSWLLTLLVLAPVAFADEGCVPLRKG